MQACTDVGLIELVVNRLARADTVVAGKIFGFTQSVLMLKTIGL